jgi:hypothetical protein
MKEEKKEGFIGYGHGLAIILEWVKVIEKESKERPEDYSGMEEEISALKKKIEESVSGDNQTE